MKTDKSSLREWDSVLNELIKLWEMIAWDGQQKAILDQTFPLQYQLSELVILLGIPVLYVSESTAVLTNLSTALGLLTRLPRALS